MDMKKKKHVPFQKLFEFTQPMYEKNWIEINLNLNWFEFD